MIGVLQGGKSRHLLRKVLPRPNLPKRIKVAIGILLGVLQAKHEVPIELILSLQGHAGFHRAVIRLQPANHWTALLSEELPLLRPLHSLLSILVHILRWRSTSLRVSTLTPTRSHKARRQPREPSRPMRLRWELILRPSNHSVLPQATEEETQEAPDLEVLGLQFPDSSLATVSLTRNRQPPRSHHTLRQHAKALSQRSPWWRPLRSCSPCWSQCLRSLCWRPFLLTLPQSLCPRLKSSPSPMSSLKNQCTNTKRTPPRQPRPNPSPHLNNPAVSSICHCSPRPMPSKKTPGFGSDPSKPVLLKRHPPRHLTRMHPPSTPRLLPH